MNQKTRENLTVIQGGSSPSGSAVISNTEGATQSGGNGGGGSDGINFRLQRLEKDVDGIREVLTRLEPILSKIDERQQHLATKVEIAKLPTRWELIAILIALLGVTQIPSILDAYKKFAVPQQPNLVTQHESQGSHQKKQTQ